MILNFGPIIFGFIFGLILGSQVKNNPISGVNFTTGSYVVILIVGIIFSWLLGQFPYYNDTTLSTAFLAALIGVLLGKFLFARGSSN